MKIFRKALLTIIILSATAIACAGFGTKAFGAIFPDLIEDSLYYPSIARLYEQHFVAGDTRSGTFRPTDTINRAEFAKITAYTRLAEEYGIKDSWMKKDNMDMAFELFDLLKPYFGCGDGACANIGGVPFTDVKESNPKCMDNIGDPNACEPWFSRYIYYAVSKGYIKGYTNTDGKKSYKPMDNILRIHALKMIIADNGNISPESDIRYKRLASQAVSLGSYSPKCLKGAENYIKDLNGGNTSDAEKLLKYALLADRLDLFGNDCEVFGGNRTPEDRALFLNKPLTRGETPRYFSITTAYTPVRPVTTDTTINTPAQNKNSVASDRTYKLPTYERTPLYNKQGADESVWGNGAKDGQQTDTGTTAISKTTNKPAPVSPKITKPTNANKTTSAKNTSDDIKPLSYYVAPGKTIRICEKSDNSKCQNYTINGNFNIDENNAVTGENVNGNTIWYAVTINGKTYYVSLGDLTGDDFTQSNPVADLNNINIGSSAQLKTQQGYVLAKEAEEQKKNITANLGSGAQNKTVPDKPNWAEPINVLTGNFWSEKTDLSIPTRGQTIEIKRTYNAQNLVDSPMGIGWSFEYDIKLTSNQFGDKIINFGDGHTLYFSKNDNGDYVSKYNDELIISDDGSSYRAKDGITYEFSDKGDLLSIKDRFENGVYFNKSDGDIGVISDDTGPLFYIKYDNNNHIQRVTDKSGRRVTYYYDDAGNLTKVKNPMGGVYEYSYDEKHRLLTIKNELGHVMITNVYDDKDRVLEQTDVMGGVSKLTYFDGRTDLTDPMGYTRSHFYNEYYQTTAEVDSFGNKKEFIYDDAGQLKQLIEPNGTKTTFEYDEYGNRTKVTDALGNITLYEYNKDHQIISVTDARGAVSTMKYDDKGALIESADALGNITAFEYNEFGQKVKQTDPRGAVTKWIYNKDGTLKESIDALGNTTEYSYDNIRQVISTKDVNGNTTNFDYNKKGNLIKKTDALGNSSETVFDESGNKMKEINENGVKTRYAYDDKNRLIRETDATGGETEYTYDLNDRLIKLNDANENISLNFFDPEGRLILNIPKEGFATRYEYDANGNKTVMTDANGNKTLFEYDALNRLTKTTDPLGAVTKFVYDASGNLIETTDAQGNKTTASFDFLNRLIGSTGPLGDKTHYKFDESGNKIAMTDPLGNTTNFQYDFNGNLIEKINADGSYTKYTNDKFGRPVEEIDANGNKTLTKYDQLGRITSITDAMGKMTEFEYDNIGNRIAVIDAMGNKTKFSFDRLNRVTKVKDAMGGETKNKYDGKGNIIKITDARGSDLNYEYNSSGLITRATNEGGLITKFKYDRNGNRVQTSLISDKNIHNSFYGFDALNRMISSTDALGDTVKTEYDLLGNKITEINALGAKVRNDFDANGHLIKTTDTFGNKQINTYDLNGNLISATDMNGNTKQLAYDTENRLISMTDPSGNTLKYEYDGIGNKIAVIDPTGIKTSYKFDADNRLIATLNEKDNGDIYEYDSLGNKISQSKISADGKTFGKTTYTYDPLRRLTSATDALGGTVKYGYDENSNRTRITDQNGAVSITEFDRMNRPSETKDALGNTETYKYDGFGNLIALTDKNGITESREYDALSRMIRKQKGDIIITQKYDALGNITDIADNSGEIKSDYNEIGFLTKTTDAKGNETKYSYDKTGNVLDRSDLSGTVDYKYNNRNLIEQIAFTPKESKEAQLFKYSYDPRGFNTSVVSPDGAQTTNNYDELGRLIAIKTNDKLSMRYEYNDFDMKTKSMTLTGDTKTEESYNYDDAGRLAKWTKDGKTTEYNYDPAYNRVSVTADGKTSNYTYNQLNQLVADGISNYEYDKNGSLTKIISAAGSTALSGAPTVDTDVSLTWDPLNRLTDYKSDKTDISYSYDTLNRMTARNNTKFEYAGLANQFVVQSETGTDTTYLYDMNGSPLAWYNQNRPHAFLKNAHNDVVGSLSNDGLGGVTSYEPFGSLSSKLETLNSKYDNLGFQGQFTDSDSGLSILGARVYNADTAQFLSPDSFPAVTSQPNSANRYAYSHNDPVNFWDVTGAYSMDLHYGKTKDWAYEAAMNIGFSYNMSRQLALNIASFDQYHDKEWSLAPNNYGDFDANMTAGGQGNALHFTNPNRQQVSYDGNVAEPGKGPFTIATINAGNEYSDNLVHAVEATTIPVYAMKSMNDFNTSDGAKTLIGNPNAIHSDFKYDLYLKAGTPRERLQYAIDNHDPRLFGIALHEYQDSFAHAGFNLWHGMSKENDFYCESETDKSYCKGKIVSNTYRGSSDGSTGTVTTFDDKYVTIGAQLLERDRLMKEGTQYWMTKFMEDQADYYKESIYAANKVFQSFNKEEKIIHDANKVLKTDENDDDYYWYKNGLTGFGAYAEQGFISGKNKCMYLDGNNIQINAEIPQCVVYINDLSNQIKRQ
jgi:RHS repeat-associated protein